MTNSVTAAAIAEVDTKAFEAFKTALEGAFKADGLRGVIQTAEDLGTDARAYANSMDDPVNEVAYHVAMALYVEQDFVPKKLALCARIEAAGGLEALLAAK